MALAILCMLLLASLACLASANIPKDGCYAGEFVNGTDCSPCPVGTYQPVRTFEEEREACKRCTSGYTCSNESLAHPDGSCQSGYYCPQGSTISSFTCPPDFYCPYHASAPSACPASTISGPGSASSSDCEDTRYIGSPGTYWDGYSNYDCPSGTFQPSWVHRYGSDNETCQPCPVGQYCAIPKLAAPSGPCVGVPGHYCPMRSTSPTDYTCPKYFYCPANNTSPIPCPGGTSSSPGAADISECFELLISCPPGTYKNGSECGVCPIGTYQPSPMSVDGTCTTCGSRFYCTYPRASSMTGPCEAGYYCPGGCTTPNEKLCPEDHYCPAGTESPLECPNETVSQNGETSVSGCIKEEDNTDVNCGPGTYTNSNGECEDCPVGTYQPGWSNGKGLYICKYCDEGSYCKSPGLAATSGLCAMGFYCPIRSTKRTQQLCLINHYCPAGVSTPISCPPGRTSKSGSTDVAECAEEMDCPSGFVPNGMLCSPCPEGTHKTSNGPGACSHCPEHSYCSGLGNGEPTGYCSAGYYCPNGSRSAIASICPADSYCPEGDRIYCYYSSYPGSTSEYDCSWKLPSLCREGWYNKGSNCYKCPAGYYKPVADRSGVESCLACPAGFHCLEGSANPARKCAAGYFCPVASGSQMSIICPFDHYCPEGNSKPIPCPAGKQSPAGSSSC